MFIKVIKGFFSKLEEITVFLSIIFFIFSSFIIVLQVLARYLFSFSFVWVEELSRYLIIYMALMGSSIVLKKDQHPRVELIYDFLPERIKYWVNYLFYTLILVFLGILTWQGIESTLFTWNDYTPALQIRMAIPYLAIPIGGFLMICQCIFLIKKNIVKHGQRE